jgi:hypothetical protein
MEIKVQAKAEVTAVNSLLNLNLNLGLLHKERA